MIFTHHFTKSEVNVKNCEVLPPKLTGIGGDAVHVGGDLGDDAVIRLRDLLVSDAEMDPLLKFEVSEVEDKALEDWAGALHFARLKPQVIPVLGQDI